MVQRRPRCASFSASSTRATAKSSTEISLPAGLVGALDIAAGARLARYFGTTPQFWLNLQTTYELDMVEDLKGEQIAAIQPLEVA